MLELGTPLSVHSTAGPVIIPSDVLPNTLIDHWLNGKHMARFHETRSFVLGVVRHVGSLMEHASSPVSIVRPHNRQSQWFYMVCNDVAALSVHSLGLAVGNGLHQRDVSVLHQELRRVRHLTNEVGLIQVGVEPVLVETHVDVDDVSFLQGAGVGDSVADDLIDRCAATSGEKVVVEGGRIGVVGDDELVNLPVNLLSRHSWRHQTVPQVQSLPSEPASLPDFIDFLLRVHWDHSVCLRLEPNVGLATLGIVGLLDVVRHLSLALERVGVRPQRTLVVERIRLLSLLMEQFVNSPETFEAGLVAEVGGGKTHLHARGALQSRGFLALRVLAHVHSFLFFLSFRILLCCVDFCHIKYI